MLPPELRSQSQVTKTLSTFENPSITSLDEKGPLFHVLAFSSTSFGASIWIRINFSQKSAAQDLYREAVDKLENSLVRHNAHYTVKAWEGADGEQMGAG